MSAGPRRWHHTATGAIDINVPLLCDYLEPYDAAFRHRYAWCDFMLQALGTDLRMVPPMSIGLDINQFPIYSAMKSRFSLPFPLIRPLAIEQASSESSVGWPGYSLCCPPPLILKASFTRFSFMFGLNSRNAPMTSPSTAPHRTPFILLYMPV